MERAKLNQSTPRVKLKEEEDVYSLKVTSRAVMEAFKEIKLTMESGHITIGEKVIPVKVGDYLIMDSHSKIIDVMTSRRYNKEFEELV